MGMDLYIIRRRNKGTPNEESVESYYAHKFWELLEAPFVKEYNESEHNCYVCAPIRSREEIDQLIEIATHNRDYWGEFKSVPELCELRAEFPDMVEEGWTYTLEADW